MDSIQAGLVAERHLVVDESLCTAHLGEEVGPVLSTPKLAGVIERMCLEAVLPLLPDAHGTVGGRIEVKHLAPTPIGLNLRIRAELAEVNDNRLTWRAEAFDDVEKVAECTHLRAVIGLEKVKSRIAEKKARIGN